MTIQWKDIEDEGLVGFDYYGLDDKPTPKRVKHLLTIEIEEVPSEGSLLVKSVIQSLQKEIEDMRSLLHKTGTGAVVRDRYRPTAGRFVVDIVDQGGRADLSRDHHLVAYPSEDGPGEGQWTEDYDWEVRHPKACTPEAQFDDLCPFIEHVQYSGRDAFGNPKDWPEPPFKMRVRHVVHETPSGPWGPAEYDIYIEQDPEETG